MASPDHHKPTHSDTCDLLETQARNFPRHRLLGFCIFESSFSNKPDKGLLLVAYDTSDRPDLCTILPGKLSKTGTSFVIDASRHYLDMSTKQLVM